MNVRLGILLLMTGIAANAQTWDSLVDRFFDQGYYRFNPSQATYDGFHQYDGQLEDYSRPKVDEQVRILHQFEKEVENFPAAKLNPDQSADREIVLGKIRSTLLNLETIRYWETNPDLYSSTASTAVFNLMSRTFAPPEVRLKDAIERELAMPKQFEAARANLKNPPRIFTEVALEQLPGIISFFESDVPLAFSAVKDTALLDRFHRANQSVIDSLRGYRNFLKTDLLPRSHGDFRLGADSYRKKLLYDEMADLPLDRLLQVGYDDLRHNQQMLRDTAKKIDPSKTPQQILEDAGKDHPAPDKLLETFQNTLVGLRDFVRQHHIATVPSDVLPRVEETPPFMRALTFASMDTPGPYEKVATEAWFNVTLPEKSWTPRQVEEHMAAFNRGVIISTAIHEVFPGHYVQFLWIHNAPSKVRKLIGANSNVEGWAHYCEQMMIDEGYGGNNNLRLRLGQLQDALLRNARFIVGIEMHTGKMTFDQGVDFFVKEGMQTRTNGERETKRGTSDPIYLY